MEATIRKVQPGDESTLAYIQTESWKSAFKGILKADILERCTNIEKATSMYKSLLDENKGNGYIQFVDGKPHCIAYWDAARDETMKDKAELICIHSLPGNWGKGYGRSMMERVLEDIKAQGFNEVYLWVFTENYRARRFYEYNGFTCTDKIQPALGTEEICYEKGL